MKWKETLEYVPVDGAVPKPNENLVEIVRCKDCKYLTEDNVFECGLRGFPVDEEWFCADGERRTDDA